MQLPRICSALFSSIFPRRARGDWGYSALLWQQTFRATITDPAEWPRSLATLYIQCHILTLAAVLQHEVNYRPITIMTCRPESSLNRAVCLNVTALCLSIHSTFTSRWIIRSQCVSLPRLLFLLCQAGELPGLSLRFDSFCFEHLEANIREYKILQTQRGSLSLAFSNCAETVSWG